MNVATTRTTATQTQTAPIILVVTNVSVMRDTKGLGRQGFVLVSHNNNLLKFDRDFVAYLKKSWNNFFLEVFKLSSCRWLK